MKGLNIKLGRSNYWIGIFGWLISLNLFAQQPKMEIRAVWVSTVYNLDWPSVADRIHPENQKATFIELLDSAQSWNLNTIFLQIRPKSDALYQSDLTPWSEFISGSRGTSPGYDPLQFAIDEAHKRGIELHGWLNPYRFENALNENDGSPNGVYDDNPHWLLYYDDERILNPGEPEVMQHLKDVVGEIITKYDIDGIHFDDYFYPYSGTNDEDNETYQNNGAGFDNIEDWRRNNISQMMRMVMDTIMDVKPYVRFGVSPFGIYGNGQDPQGVFGLDAYNTLYTDPIEWMADGSVDYLCPQLYWPTGGDQDFGKLLPWWAEKAAENNRHMMAGHGIYRLDDNPSSRSTSNANPNLHEYKQYFDFEQAKGIQSWPLSEVGAQIDIIRNNVHNNAYGSAYFRFNDFLRVNGLAEYINDNYYSAIALMPPMDWKEANLPVGPSMHSWETDENGISFLVWDIHDSTDRYVIYGSDSDSEDANFFTDPANILKINYDNKFTIDGTTELNTTYLHIKSYDRYGNESESEYTIGINSPTASPDLVFPADLATNQTSDFTFQWTSVDLAQAYVIQIAKEETFANLEFETEVLGNSIGSTEFELKGEEKYYWRVFSLNAAGNGPVSEVYEFTTGFPAEAVVTTPSDDEQNVVLSPLFKWQANTTVESINLELSKGGNEFKTFNVIHEADLGAVTEYQFPETLLELTTYHLRLKQNNVHGESDWTYVSFRTLKLPPQSLEITSPIEDGSQLVGEDVVVEWSEAFGATGYTLVVSTDAERQSVIEEVTTNFNVRTYTFSDLIAGDYFISVSGTNIGGIGPWDQVSYSIIKPLDVEDWEHEGIKIAYTLQNHLVITTDSKPILGARIFDLLGREYGQDKLKINPHQLTLNLNEMRGLGVVFLEFEEEVRTIKFSAK